VSLVRRCMNGLGRGPLDSHLYERSSCCPGVCQNCQSENDSMTAADYYSGYLTSEIEPLSASYGDSTSGHDANHGAESRQAVSESSRHWLIEETMTILGFKMSGKAKRDFLCKLEYI
jgi:hypothetical protein